MAAPNRPEEQVWPARAQWCLAVMLALGSLLVGWRGWGLSRYSTNPLPLERSEEAESLPGRENAEASLPPRVARGKVTDETPSWTSRKPLPETTLDLNQASREQLQTLPGIGPTLASRIVEARQEKPFTSLEDLRRVKGIGVKTLEKLRRYAQVQGK